MFHGILLGLRLTARRGYIDWLLYAVTYGLIATLYILLRDFLLFHVHEVWVLVLILFAPGNSP